MGLLAAEENCDSLGIAPQNFSDNLIEVGMNLKEGLMANIPARVRRQREVVPAELRSTDLRFGKIMRRIGEPDETLRVMQVRIGRLEQIGGKEIVDRRNPRRDRMPQSHALHGSQARECEEISP